MTARKPTNMLKMSRKPSLKKSPVLAEAEKIVKEREKADRLAVKAEKKPVVKKATTKKTPAKKTAIPKVRKDPMWKHLAAALKKQTK